MREIEAKDIRKGDVIRTVFDNWSYKAIEYVAEESDVGVLRFPSHSQNTYLLKRAFKPRWGMVIGDPHDIGFRAVYIPGTTEDDVAWLTDYGWFENEWAIEKMNENGWVEIIGVRPQAT